MNIQESGEMYLETILVLLRKQPYVRAIDIGEHMGFSKPSVSRAVGLLKQASLISVNTEGHIFLTDTGKELAEKIYERHTLLTRFLMHLGVDEAVAAEDACKIEHDISDASFAAIKAFADGLTNDNG